MEQYIVVQVLKKSLAPCECSAKQSTMAESPIRPIDKGTGTVLHSVLACAKRNGLNEFEYWRAVLVRLSDVGSESELQELLSDEWKKEA
jgi:hypothetical protein